MLELDDRAMRSHSIHSRGSRPAAFLLVTVALALGGCKSKSSPVAPVDAETAADAPGVDVPGRQVVDLGAPADRAVPDRSEPDLAADQAPAIPDSSTLADASSTNPRRLWLTGPESDIHLSDVEPATPF